MRRPRVPSYRPHSSGQARVTLNGKDVLLGPYGSAESQEHYRRIIREWLEAKQQPVPEPAEPITLNELILAYWKHAEVYYGFAADPTRGDGACLKAALAVVKSLYGSTPAAEFGPRALKACRAEMVSRGWARSYVNAQVDRVRRMFRWGAEEELVAASVHQGLLAVAGLRRGKTEARETAKVRPVPQEDLDATLPHLQPAAAALVRFQFLTGCRPAEACLLRPCDIDRTDPACWVYQPARHKTAHHGKDRLVFLGPRAQEVLQPYLQGPADAYCFSPAASETARQNDRRSDRKTPMWPSHLRRNLSKRKAARRRAPRERYDVASYRRAVARACDAAFPLPEALRPRVPEGGKRESRAAWWARLTEAERAQVKAWRRQHRWHPNRLRHNRATELRRHGLDVAKTILGHAKVETTQVYAEKDLAAARELVARVG
jgi:integrase